MLQLRTAAFVVGWTLLTTSFGLLFLPGLISQRVTWKLSDFWVYLSLGWLRICCNITSETRGTVTTSLIACKHQSTWDTLMLWRCFGNPVFVLKRELYLIPVFGWYLWRTGQIGINRRAGRDAYAQIQQQATRVLAQGRVIIMFPEGTRVRIGTHKPYRSGIARVSALLKLPVTPAALNAGLFWPKHSPLKRPGHAVLEFLPAMQASDSDTGAWMAELESTIEKNTQALLASATE